MQADCVSQWGCVKSGSLTNFTTQLAEKAQQYKHDWNLFEKTSKRCRLTSADERYDNLDGLQSLPLE